ncbi:MAG: hypothetical protein HYU29_06205 [Chloroflexi bacterium]|nr:hypothetical protein [Chloroflexota bacterium]
MPKVLSHIPAAEHPRVTLVLSTLLSNTRRVLLTPQVFTEFQVVAQNRARLSAEGLGEFLLASLPIFQSAEQYPISFADLVEFKSKTNSWRLSFVDTSVLWAATVSRLPVLTIDGPLVDHSKRLKVRALHLLHVARQA